MRHHNVRSIWSRSEQVGGLPSGQDWPDAGFLDLLPQMAWSADAQGRNDHYNHHWYAFTGIAFGMADGERRLALVHPEDREEARRAWACARAGNQPYEAVYRLRHHAGDYRWILSRAQPQLDENGQVVRWYGVCTDVHQQVMAQKALDGSEEQSRLMLDSLSQMIWSADADGNYDYFSPQWSEFTGMEPRDGSSRDILIHPDDCERVKATWIEDRQAGVRYEHRYRLRHVSGEYRWVLSRGCPIRQNGKIVRWCGSLTDINQQVLAEERLQASEERFREILDSMPQMVWTNQEDGGQSYYNRQWYDFLGIGQVGANEVRRSDRIHPADRERAMARWDQSIASGEPYECEYRLQHASGVHRWVFSRAVRQLAADGTIRWYGTTTDVHERMLAQQALRASEAVNRSILDASGNGIKMLDRDGRIVFANDAAVVELEAEHPDALLGKLWVEMFPAESAAAARRTLDDALREGRAQLNVLRPTLKGSPRWCDILVTPVIGDEAEASGFVVTTRDVTHQKGVEDRVRWTADHDALTELPNRRVFQQRLDAYVGRARRAGEHIGLLLLDLDDFKQINDSLGHDAGDRLLCTVAERLRRALAGQGLAARFGGDEFAVLLENVGGLDEVMDVANAILAQLREPFVHEGRVLDCRATIGVSIHSDPTKHPSELLKQADIALYVAKTTGRGRAMAFESPMRAELQNRNSMLALARNAIDEGAIDPFYQPKIDLNSGRIAGFEALLRWHHPRLGLQNPATIAAAFEDLDLAAAISDRMFDQVVRDVRGWLDRGIEFEHVALNASAAEFRRGDFADRLIARLDRAGVPPHCLQVEVTETVFLGRGSDFVVRALRALSEAGIEIALDDFGTGFASLSHLKQFPVDTIKIDRSFVRDLEQDPDDAAIVRAVIQLGASLDIKVVAEGVEAAAQEKFLIEQGCGYGQGYLYGKAVASEQVPMLVDNWAGL